MRWSERQLAMLREMGVASFWPVSSAAPAAPAAPAASAVAAPPEPAASIESQPPTEVSAPDVASRPAGVETMDWATLEQAVASCQACALCQNRSQTVFGVGSRSARWMIVGEAPGEQEDRQGEPFVGRAGQLLDRMLAALGLSRDHAAQAGHVYIANVLKCRPPANRNPQPQEVAQCEPFLLRQMALVQPDIVLAMGRFAAQSLLKTTEPIGKLRGRVHEVAGVPVVVTYHPAYLLRNPADKALAWDDLCLARERQARRQSVGGSPR